MNYIYTLKDFRCDKQCPYCITKILNNRNVKEDVKDFKTIFKNGVNGKSYDYFNLSGNGEPSLYSSEDLKVIVETVNKSNKFKGKRVQTSGLLFRQNKKLNLFKSWWKEITVVSADHEKDKEFFKYKNHYLDLTLNRKDVRCNYTMLLSKFNSKEYLEDIIKLTKDYKYVALKLLDTKDPWVISYGVPYEFKDYILEELLPILGTATYNTKGCRYEWEKSGCFISMSYGKESGHDDIQIDKLEGGRA